MLLQSLRNLVLSLAKLQIAITFPEATWDLWSSLFTLHRHIFHSVVSHLGWDQNCKQYPEPGDILRQRSYIFPSLFLPSFDLLDSTRMNIEQMFGWDAVKGNHHHPCLPGVHVGGHQGRVSSGALASHSGHLVNDNGDSRICFSTNSSYFLLLHLLYELTPCAVSLLTLANWMSLTTLYLLEVCGKPKYCLKLSSIANSIFLKTLPLLPSLTTNALFGEKPVYSFLLLPSRSYTAGETRWWDAGFRVFCVLTAPQTGRARADTG